MHIYLLAAVGILSFLFLADKSQWRLLFPTMVLTAYIRFIEQYILVDIAELWEYGKLGTPLSTLLNIPVLVDLFFYPAMGYLFIQKYPETRSARLVYTMSWAIAFTLNELYAVSQGTIKQDPVWHWFLSFLLYVVALILLVLQHRFFLSGRNADAEQTNA